MKRSDRARLLLVTLALSGCQFSNHNALAPGGIQARRIATEFWTMLAVYTLVFLLTIGAAIWAFLRGRRRTEPLVDAATQSKLRRNVSIAVAVTALILVGFMVTDFALGRAVDSFSAQPKRTLTIQAIGHQWWWEFMYEDSVAARAITSTNELHIPTGRPVLIKLQSHDVIHSFWVPGLQGKRDLMPGYTTMLWLRADKPGIYEGQCAEFCGFQHAKMRLTVVAHPPSEFARWYEAAMRPAVTPTDSLAIAGRRVFMTGPCVMCHSIRGEPAGGRLGPDLTHLASQRRIAGNTYPNNRGFLAAWIRDAQQLKPGVRMPPIRLQPKDLDALLSYLETLK
ncbi:MAG TPA: cytochrome c oxidase subunit II [Longimicrobiales bacterium]